MERTTAIDPRVAVLLAELRAHRPIDPRERDSIERSLDALARLRRPFDRADSPTHVTGSAIVMRPLDGSDDLEVLLHLHRRIGRWLQPGGHIDGVETPLDAARRETVEETGIATRPVDGFLLHVDVHETPNGHIHLDMRYLLSPIDPAAGPAPGPEESQQVRWFLLREAQAFADPGLTGALAGAAGRLGMTAGF